MDAHSQTITAGSAFEFQSLDTAATADSAPRLDRPASLGYLLTTLSLLGIVALDTFDPVRYVTGSWWVVLLLVWVLPWPNRKLDGGRPCRLDGDALLQLATLVVLGWVYLRACTALADSLSSWRIMDPEGPVPLLAYPARTGILAVVVAGLIAAPVQRAFGSRAVIAMIVIAAPTIAICCIEKLSDITRWVDRPVSVAVHTFRVVFPMLLVMLVCERLERHSSRGTGRDRPRRTLLGKLGPLFDRCPRWFARSALAPMLLLLAATAVMRVWAVQRAGVNSAVVVIAALAMTSCALLVTAAVVHELRKRREVGRPSRVRGMLVYRLRGVVSVAVLAPLWAWTLMIEAPLAEYHALEAVAAVPGPAWTMRYERTTQTLHLSGEYQRGIGHAFNERLKDLRDVRVIELAGPGGSEYEGFLIAEAIERRNLDTHVRDDCASSCTLAFVAGRERTVAKEASLGFHAGSSPIAAYADDDENYNEYLSGRGVTEEFIRKAGDVPAADMWYPDNEELLAAHVVTGIR
jgi:hypothetical protein